MGDTFTALHVFLFSYLKFWGYKLAIIHFRPRDCFGPIFLSTMDTIPGFHVLTCQPAANLPSVHGAIWSTCLSFVPPFIRLQET